VNQDAVGEEVLAFCHFEKSVGVFLVGMDAAIAAQAEDVEFRVIFAGVGERFHQRFVFEKRAIADAAGDAHGFLVDDAARANVLVADFGVSHDARGEADVFAAGFDECVGEIAHEPVVDGVFGQFDGIVGIHFGMRILAPAIAHN
jgi:hypothetical protein